MATTGAAQPPVTVFTPVYNGEQFLRECIESMLAQTYQNWRYIILNNASTDRTGEIAEEYARADSRISVARNDVLLPIMQNHNRCIGLAAQTDARYIKPLFADDYLYPTCIEKLVAVAEAHPSVGLVCNWAFDGRNVCWDGLQHPAEILPGRTMARLVLQDDVYVFGTPTSTLLRADLVRKRDKFYNDEHWHGDYEACLDLLQESDFSFVHEVLSFNRVHDGRQSTVAESLNSIIAGDLYVLRRYGPVFLSPEEYAYESEQLSYLYYQMLANALLARRDGKFWAYHRAFMEKAGMPISRWKVADAVVRLIWGRLAAIPRSA